MNCPYCAEEIKDEAIVCHHCGRDLTFFKPIQEQLRQLNVRVSTLEDTACQVSEVVDGMRFKSQTSAIIPVTEKTERPSLIHFAVLTIGQVVTSTVLMLTGVLIMNTVVAFFRQEYPSSGVMGPENWRRFNAVTQGLGITLTWILIPLLLLSPLPFGFWLGIKWRGSHLRFYVGLGLAAGVLEAAVILILTGVSILRSNDIHAVIVLSLVNLTRTTLSFTTGALAGDVIERLRFGSSSTHYGFAERLAKRLISSRKPADSENSYSRRLKGTADVISALAPVLTFIAALVTAYISYLATIAAAKK